jgi:hypothetical protein
MKIQANGSKTWRSKQMIQTKSILFIALHAQTYNEGSTSEDLVRAHASYL